MPKNSIHSAVCPFCGHLTTIAAFDSPTPAVTSCPHFLALVTGHKVRFGAEAACEPVATMREELEGIAREMREAGGDVTGTSTVEKEGISD